MDKNRDTKEKSQAALREEEILKLWQEKKIFEKTLEKPSPKGEFIFYEGPPTANGRPGIHHLEARAFKDAIPRFKTMQGYHVRRKGGWDTHGLPVELEVEKELGISSKKEIEEKIGIETFNKKCRESVWRYVDEWERFTGRMGYWVDQKKPYVTYHSSYIESVWSVLKKVDEQKLLYKDYKVLPWCPRCGTALSSHELAQGYKETTDPSVYVKFELVDEPGTYFLVWTTTPWTLPSNLALAINSQITYSYITLGNERYIVSSERTKYFFDKKFFTAESAKVEREVMGADLVGRKYKSLFSFIEGERSVYAADFVSTEDGTGIVHIAPMYGADDFALGTKENLPKKHLVGEDGKFLPEAGDLAGLFFKDADKVVIDDLEKRNLLFKKETVTHTYPFCWRCKTPLIYYARSSWYIKMSLLRDKLIFENEKINWEPKYIKDGRFGEWLKDVKDWAISRERYWGTPLPIWMSVDGEYRVVGSIDELKQKIGSQNKYILMRHGEAENNTTGIISAKRDNPHHLTENGKRMVKESTEKLKGEKIDLIFASPFIRTRETVAIVAEALALSEDKIIFDDRLGEIDTGVFNLKPVGEYHAFYSGVLEKFTKAPPQGETLLDVKKRAGEFLYEIEKREKGKNILIITHEYPAWMITAIANAWTDHESAIKKEEADDFILPAEWRPLSFVPLPHDESFSPDMHRPYIDQVVFTENGKEFKRVPEVLDVWFDSGAMPFAQDHYPFENKTLVEGPGYPADFISEAIDQTRGWFYTLHAVGVLMGRGAAYRNVICLGHILDKEGKKMSKSVGNTVDPWLMMDKYGADVLRMWMYTVNQPGESKNFDEATVAELSRKTTTPLLNILSFYKTYSSDAALVTRPESTHILDKWLLASLDSLTKEVTDSLLKYNVLTAGRSIRDFIGDFSQWYLRRSRERFKGDDVNDRRQASLTTGFTLLTLAKLLAPFMPFLAEYLYQEVSGESKKDSVHLEDWPREGVLDEQILLDMKFAREVVEEALSVRAKEKIKIRQPLSSLTYMTKNERLKEGLEEVIRDEVNVKKIIWQKKDDTSLSVTLDTTLTPELTKEGQARELIRSIQDLRKESGLKAGDLAHLFFSGNKEALDLVRQFEEEIKKATTLSEIKILESLSGEEKKDGSLSYIISFG